MIMGIWDHFYNNSALDKGISIHFASLPHYAEFRSKHKIILDERHAEFEWFDLSVVSNDKKNFTLLCATMCIGY